MAVSRVRGLLATPSRDEEFVTATVPVLVGREEESGLLRRRWEQSKAGVGQVVLRQRRGRHWQVGPGGGAAGAGARRGVAAHGLSLFALSHHQCPLSRDHPPRAPVAVCAGRSPRHQAGQIGGGAAALWPAAGRGGAAVGRVAVGAAAGGALCGADVDAAATETADAGRAGGVAGGRGRAAAGAGGVGRPALGRPHHAGGPRAGHRAGAHGADVARADVSPGVQPALAATLPHDPSRAQPPGAPAGRGADYPAGGRQNPAGRGGAAHRGQNGWGAAVCRRADQDAAGLAAAAGRGGPVCAHRAAAHGGDSGHLTGCAHGPAGSAPDGQRGGAARGGAGAGVCL